MPAPDLRAYGGADGTPGHDSLDRGMLGDGIAYGGDYNPEQWSDAHVTEDIELMKAAGVTVVTLGVFSWALLEPSPGHYELGWLRSLMDRLHAAGIGIDLATATASPPPWLGALHPDTLPVTNDGVRLVWGSRQQYNPSSAVLREKIAQLVARLAVEFANHPGLVAWHINNEYGCHVAESFDDESAARFRIWLQDKHGSLEALNAAWGTTFWSQRFRDWSEVLPPRATTTTPNPHQFVDWRAFCSDTLLDLYLLEKRILRRANPRIPITTNFMGLFGPVDYWSWAPHLDFISNDTYPDPADPRAARQYAFDCDLMRSLKHGQPFVQMEQVTSAVQWRPRNAAKRPGQYQLWSMQAVSRGADGILNFQWRQSVSGAETFHGAMLPHAGTQSRTWKEVVDLGGRLKDISEVRGKRIDCQIAIVWDWMNAWTQRGAFGPVDDQIPEIAARNWHASLFEQGHLVDFVHPDDDLTGYRLVIVPALFRLTETHAQRLREAVRAGTSLLVTSLTGYVDHHGHAVEGGYLGAVHDVLGVRITDITPLDVVPDVRVGAEELDPRTDRISSAVGTPAALSDLALRGESAAGFDWHGNGLRWSEHVVIDDATAVEVVARFAEGDHQGSPAITVRTHDREDRMTHAWYLGTELDSSGRDDLLALILARAGVHPGIDPDTLPPGVSATTRGDLVFFLNHGDSDVVVHGLTREPIELPSRSAKTMNVDALISSPPTGITANNAATPVATHGVL